MLCLSCNTTDVKIKAIAMLLFVLEVLALVQALEDTTVDRQDFLEKTCDLMLVSNAEKTEGKVIFFSFPGQFLKYTSFRFWWRYCQISKPWKTIRSERKRQIQVYGGKNVMFADNS